MFYILSHFCHFLARGRMWWSTRWRRSLMLRGTNCGTSLLSRRSAAWWWSDARIVVQQRDGEVMRVSLISDRPLSDPSTLVDKPFSPHRIEPVSSIELGPETTLGTELNSATVTSHQAPQHGVLCARLVHQVRTRKLQESKYQCTSGELSQWSDSGRLHDHSSRSSWWMVSFVFCRLRNIEHFVITWRPSVGPCMLPPRWRSDQTVCCPCSRTDHDSLKFVLVQADLSQRTKGIVVDYSAGCRVRRLRVGLRHHVVGFCGRYFCWVPGRLLTGKEKAFWASTGQHHCRRRCFHLPVALTQPRFTDQRASAWWSSPRSKSTLSRPKKLVRLGETTSEAEHDHGQVVQHWFRSRGDPSWFVSVRAVMVSGGSSSHISYLRRLHSASPHSCGLRWSWSHGDEDPWCGSLSWRHRVDSSSRSSSSAAEDGEGRRKKVVSMAMHTMNHRHRNPQGHAIHELNRPVKSSPCLRAPPGDPRTIVCP